MTRRWLRIWSLGDCYFCVSDKTHLSHAVHPSIQENLWEPEKNCQLSSRLGEVIIVLVLSWDENWVTLCLIRLFFQILRKGNPPLLRMRMSFRKVFLVLSGEYLKVIFTRDAIGRRYFFSQQIKKCPKPCIALMAIRLNTGKTSSQTPWKKPPSQWPWKKVSSPD